MGFDQAMHNTVPSQRSCKNHPSSGAARHQQVCLDSVWIAQVTPTIKLAKASPGAGRVGAMLSMCKHKKTSLSLGNPLDRKPMQVASVLPYMSCTPALGSSHLSKLPHSSLPGNWNLALAACSALA
jgi:hypothetical protein